MYPCGHKQLPLRDLGFPYEMSVPELLFFFAFHIFAGLVPCAERNGGVTAQGHRAAPLRPTAEAEGWEQWEKGALLGSGETLIRCVTD